MQYTELEMLYQKHLVPFIRQVERELIDFRFILPFRKCMFKLYPEASAFGLLCASWALLCAEETTCAASFRRL